MDGTFKVLYTGFHIMLYCLGVGEVVLKFMVMYNGEIHQLKLDRQPSGTSRTLLLYTIISTMIQPRKTAVKFSFGVSQTHAITPNLVRMLR